MFAQYITKYWSHPNRDESIINFVWFNIFGWPYRLPEGSKIPFDEWKKFKWVFEMFYNEHEWTLDEIAPVFNRVPSSMPQLFKRLGIESRSCGKRAGRDYSATRKERN